MVWWCVGALVRQTSSVLAVVIMLILDLCAGLKGASQAMKERGWQVVTLDFDPRFECDITADVREWHYPAELPRPDFVWASPPCDEFARESMPWSKTGKIPDMSIVLACKRIIEETQPKYYVIENVRGAINYFRPHFGNYRLHVGAFFLWGFFPVPGEIKNNWKKKESYGSKQRAERAVIPAPLSRAIAIQAESQATYLTAQHSVHPTNGTLPNLEKVPYPETSATSQAESTPPIRG